ncbi:heat shock 70 kDa protein 12A-like [Mytilus edulis]|uniref:heat shock 70 kDa protein 12A-like n=1 Tax=Mytilus edulis TaxID=6550 RepID=UPI0039EF09A6
MDSAKLFVAAFDFGTTYSGYAFSLRTAPDSIYTCNWENNNVLYRKAPTSILLNKNKDFVAFGFEAERKYIASLENDDWDSDDSDQETTDEYRYFKWFKMKLHKQTLNVDTLIKDQNGEEMKALYIFAHAIQYLKDQLIIKLRKSFKNLDTKDIHYVITVPAIWDDQSKIFMRKAAELVKIKTKALTIIPEPEAASIYCQEFKKGRNKLYDTLSDTLKQGRKHMVIDLGGRTADITVLKQHSDGLLEHVIPPCGGAWGGNAVDDAFIGFLENLFSEQVMKKLKTYSLEDYTALIHEFELKKRLIKFETTSDIVITLPIGLLELTLKYFGGINAAIKRSIYGDSIYAIGSQKLGINPQLFRTLFISTIDELLKYIDKLFKHPEVSDIRHIVMVGGFSECELVQGAMKNKFPEKEIIIPEEAGLAVLRGAVLSCHRPKQMRWEFIESPKLFVVAIDFGTTYSGYAFSAKSSPNEIQTCHWQDSTLLSTKAPTSVLLDKEKKFKAFGYKADAEYIESLENEDSDSDDEETDMVHYFNRFKMMLHKQIVNVATTLKDQNGVQVKALDVFSIAIKYLKDRAVEKLLQSLKNVEKDDIHYVLTVPAIWNDQAKLFMRKAAEKAGIKGYDLTIALEPETASIFCQELRTNRDNYTSKTFSETIKHGTKYLVLDLGGGTADITVHERLPDGSLEEVLPPSGGNWGGTAVDDAYIELLNSVFTKKVIKELKSDELEDYTSLCFQFEVKKRSVTSDLSTDIVISLPFSLVKKTEKHYKSVQSSIMRSPYKDSVYFTAPQKLHVNPEVFRKLFKPTIDALIKHIEKLLKDPKISDLRHIIMVGGFSECELVQKAMKKTFPNRKIIIPDDAGMAVLKGAVLFGHQPRKISKRILRKTYGIQTSTEWDPSLHHKTKKELIDGVYHCKDIFHKFAEKGEKVEEGHSHRQIFRVLNTEKRTIERTVFISDDTNPIYVTDLSCQRLGNLIIPIPPLKKDEILEIEETLMFGGTEILFRARNMKTGDIFENQFELF